MADYNQVHRSQPLERSLTPPHTPPVGNNLKIVHPRPEPEIGSEEEFSSKRQKTTNRQTTADSEATIFKITHQEVLLLHGPKQRYVHTKEQPIPSLENDREMLVAVEVVGLNPIDWKAP